MQLYHTHFYKTIEFLVLIAFQMHWSLSTNGQDIGSRGLAMFVHCLTWTLRFLTYHLFYIVDTLHIIASKFDDYDSKLKLHHYPVIPFNHNIVVNTNLNQLWIIPHLLNTLMLNIAWSILYNPQFKRKSSTTLYHHHLALICLVNVAYKSGSFSTLVKKHCCIKI